MYQVTVDFNDGKGINQYCDPVSFDKAIQHLVDLVKFSANLDSKSGAYTYNIIEIKD
jgi:hypothetical protein